MEKYITFSVHKRKFIAIVLDLYELQLVDNMSGIFDSLECKSCIEKIKMNSECCFVDLKN